MRRSRNIWGKKRKIRWNRWEWMRWFDGLQSWNASGICEKCRLFYWNWRTQSEDGNRIHIEIEIKIYIYILKVRILDLYFVLLFVFWWIFDNRIFLIFKKVETFITFNFLVAGRIALLRSILCFDDPWVMILHINFMISNLLQWSNLLDKCHLQLFLVLYFTLQFYHWVFSNFWHVFLSDEFDKSPSFSFCSGSIRLQFQINLLFSS